MNKKDIADFRKQLKRDNDSLRIREILQFYIQKESGEVFHQERRAFEMLEQEQQELLLGGFKKVLTGQLDAKLFQLKFQHGAEDAAQYILYNGLEADSDTWEDGMASLVEKMFREQQYTMDAVVTFIRGEYRKPVKKKGEDEEHESNQIYANSFILCSVNRTDMPKKALLFDYIEREFKSNVVVDAIINLAAPLTGFLFPCFTDNARDVNHVLYMAEKANQPDEAFIQHVLHCENVITAGEDKEGFEHILSRVAGDAVSTEVLAQVYKEVQRVIEEHEEEEEPPVLDQQDVARILQASGIEDTSRVELAFQEAFYTEDHQLKATSVVPNYTSKSVRINTGTAQVSLSPQDMHTMRYVILNGKRCLILEVEEDITVDGVKLQPEQF
ncbi:DUF4317 family protein [Ectobacillus ponti]|uniref:DUF4317 domain-containing protein n=1 Tax=Ectobacillus ponti TaxID=2961894 RepID=A0AA41X726_9BACI|nr:DUF4317 family protein [Ectobacillus ponti]MCP8969922.1 DUF4317 domain-containing protein [Ectobacillus ponti]